MKHFIFIILLLTVVCFSNGQTLDYLDGFKEFEWGTSINAVMMNSKNGLQLKIEEGYLKDLKVYLRIDSIKELFVSRTFYFYKEKLFKVSFEFKRPGLIGLSLNKEQIDLIKDELIKNYGNDFFEKEYKRDVLTKNIYIQRGNYSLVNDYIGSINAGQIKEMSWRLGKINIDFRQMILTPKKKGTWRESCYVINFYDNDLEILANKEMVRSGGNKTFYNFYKLKNPEYEFDLLLIFPIVWLGFNASLHLITKEVLIGVSYQCPNVTDPITASAVSTVFFSLFTIADWSHAAGVPLFNLTLLNSMYFGMYLFAGGIETGYFYNYKNSKQYSDIFLSSMIVNWTFCGLFLTGFVASFVSFMIDSNYSWRNFSMQNQKMKKIEYYFSGSGVVLRI